MQPAPLEPAQRLQLIAEILVRGYLRRHEQRQIAARLQTSSKPEKSDNSAVNGLATSAQKSVTGDDR